MGKSSKVYALSARFLRHPFAPAKAFRPAPNAAGDAARARAHSLNRI
jgi:hypothetical protein